MGSSNLLITFGKMADFENEKKTAVSQDWWNKIENLHICDCKLPEISLE